MPSSVRVGRLLYSGMDREYWTKKLQQAERELEAARKPSDVKAAASKLQRAKAELRELEAEVGKSDKSRHVTKTRRGA
jgi:hypothetical protein